VALLDQLPALTLAVRGQSLTELLKPAYLTFGRGSQRQVPEG
jgi:hypothetical protein